MWRNHHAVKQALNYSRTACLSLCDSNAGYTSQPKAFDYTPRSAYGRSVLHNATGVSGSHHKSTVHNNRQLLSTLYVIMRLRWFSCTLGLIVIDKQLKFAIDYHNLESLRIGYYRLLLVFIFPWSSIQIWCWTVIPRTRGIIIIK